MCHFALYGSGTYFFDRASEKLNQRMVQDEEREGKGAREASPCLFWVTYSKKTYRQGRSSPKNAYLAIPTLRGKEAERFVKEADKAYQNKGKTDFSKQVKIARAILKKANML